MNCTFQESDGETVTKHQAKGQSAPKRPQPNQPRSAAFPLAAPGQSTPGKLPPPPHPPRPKAAVRRPEARPELAPRNNQPQAAARPQGALSQTAPSVGPQVARRRQHAYGRLGWAAVGLLSLAALAYLAFTQAGVLLTRDDPLPRSQSLGIVLMGEVVERGGHAAELLKAGRLAKLIFFRTAKSALEDAGLTPNMAHLTQRYLDAKGIAAARYDVLDEPLVASTRDEALAIRAWVLAQRVRPQHLVVITSWFHSARAGWIFERIFAGSGISIHLSPAWGPTPKADHWWQTEEDFLNVFNEYLKWAYYLAHYGSAPRWAGKMVARNPAQGPPT